MPLLSQLGYFIANNGHQEVAVRAPTCWGGEPLLFLTALTFRSSEESWAPISCWMNNELSKNPTHKRVLNPGPSVPLGSALATQPQRLSQITRRYHQTDTESSSQDNTKYKGCIPQFTYYVFRCQNTPLNRSQCVNSRSVIPTGCNVPLSGTLLRGNMKQQDAWRSSGLVDFIILGLKSGPRFVTLCLSNSYLVRGALGQPI